MFYFCEVHYNSQTEICEFDYVIFFYKLLQCTYLLD